MSIDPQEHLFREALRELIAGNGKPNDRLRSLYMEMEFSTNQRLHAAEYDTPSGWNIDAMQSYLNSVEGS